MQSIVTMTKETEIQYLLPNKNRNWGKTTELFKTE